MRATFRSSSASILAILLAAAAGTARADVPRVAVDIAPVHSLVAQVMQGVGTPDLIVPADASPHHYALKPSQSGTLAGAGLLVRIGGGYTPWLEESASALAPDAAGLVLMEVPGTEVLPLREDAVFAASADADGHEHEDEHEHEHEHEDEHAHEGDHAHEDHDEHDHDDHGYDDHGHGHDHSGMIGDPHAWLDPHNAAVWTRAIAEALAAEDPENAETYRANAEAGVKALEDLDAELRTTLEPARGKTYVVLHDAYQYLGTHYGVDALGAISASDNTAPGPRRVEEIRAAISWSGVECIFAEPQQDTRLITLAAEGTGARIGRLDPLGSGIPTGPEHYTETMRALAGSMVDCLAAN